jgi:hypothetical protein
MSEIINALQGWGQYSWNAPAWCGSLVLVAVIWTMVWKAMAMWRAGKKGSKVWFVILLVVNTLGILDILYIYVFSKKTTPPQL